MTDMSERPCSYKMIGPLQWNQNISPRAETKTDRQGLPSTMMNKDTPVLRTGDCMTPPIPEKHCLMATYFLKAGLNLATEKPNHKMT